MGAIVDTGKVCFGSDPAVLTTLQTGLLYPQQRKSETGMSEIGGGVDTSYYNGGQSNASFPLTRRGAICGKNSANRHRRARLARTTSDPNADYDCRLLDTPCPVLIAG